VRAIGVVALSCSRLISIRRLWAVRKFVIWSFAEGKNKCRITNTDTAHFLLCVAMAEAVGHWCTSARCINFSILRIPRTYEQQRAPIHRPYGKKGS
jgi:hypothetical protein